MAFATNSAAFGIKSTAPASASIFGTKPQGSLFGGPQQQPAFGSTLGSQPQTQQQAPTSFLGGFGQQQQQQQQQQPAPTGSLFGQPQQQQQQQQPQQQNTFGTSLFGNTSTNNNTQSTNNQPAQQPGTFGSFGNFGSTTQNTQQQQGQQQQMGGWGSSTTAPNPLQAQPTLPAGGFGNANLGQPSLFGGQRQQQQPLGLSTTQPAGPPLFTKSTKFNDLPDELKRTLEEIESHIQGRVQISKELHQLKLGEEATKGQELIRGVHKELINTSSVIRSDLLFTRDLKAKADQAVQDTIIATRIVDGFRNPQQSGAYLKNHATFPLEFFSRVAQQMKERLAWYKSTIEQIERKLSSTVSQAQYTPHAISTTLQAQHATFIALASKTAALDAELQKVKALYTQLWRAKTGSMKDPFNDLDRSSEGDFGLGGLNVK